MANQTNNSSTPLDSMISYYWGHCKEKEYYSYDMKGRLSKKLRYFRDQVIDDESGNESDFEITRHTYVYGDNDFIKYQQIDRWDTDWCEEALTSPHWYKSKTLDYDTRGELLVEKQFDHAGDLEYYTTYSYDGQGYLSEELGFDVYHTGLIDVPTSIDLYSNSSDGQNFTWTSFGGRYYWDHLWGPKPTDEDWFKWGAFKEEFTYDNHGNTTRISFYGGDPDFNFREDVYYGHEYTWGWWNNRAIDWGIEGTEEYTNSYDDQGHLTSIVANIPENNYTERYTYDDQGHLTARHIIYEDGSTYEHNYIYDERGYLIEETNGTYTIARYYYDEWGNLIRKYELETTTYYYYSGEKIQISPYYDFCGEAEELWNGDYYSSYNDIQINGITADKLSQLMLYTNREITNPQSVKITVKDVNGNVITDPNIIGSFSEFHRLENDKWGVIYTAPDINTSNNSFFNNSGCYTINVEFEFSDNDSADCNFKIYRPGVIVVHGLADKAEVCWNDLERDLKDNYSPFVLNKDYETSNKKSFYDNTYVHRVIDNACFELYSKLYWDYGVVSSRYDLVGHSMGGILSRKYAQEVNPQGVNRIITVNTPHWGSEGANLIQKAILTGEVSLSGSIVALSSLLIANNNIPAYNDLQVGSKPIETLNSKYCNGIPVHAVCSYLTGFPKGDSEIQEYLKKTSFTNATSPSTFLYNQALIFFTSTERLGNINESIVKNIFRGDESDLVVALKSQRGGLPSKYCTIESDIYKGPLGTGSNAFHCNTPHWNLTINNITDLLKEPYDSPKFSKNGFSYDPYFADGIVTIPRAKPRSAAPRHASDISSEICIDISLIDSLELGNRVVRSIISYSPDIKSTLTFAALDENNVYANLNADTAYYVVPEYYSGEFVVTTLGYVEQDTYVGASDTLYFDNLLEPSRLFFSDRKYYIYEGQTIEPSISVLWDNAEKQRIDAELYADDDNILNIEGSSITGLTAGSTTLHALFEDLDDSVIVEVLPNRKQNDVTTIKNLDAKFCITDGAIHLSDLDTYSGKVDINIYDLSGKLCHRSQHNLNASPNRTITSPLTLTKGQIYFANIVTENETFNYKFIY